MTELQIFNEKTNSWETIKENGQPIEFPTRYHTEDWLKEHHPEITDIRATRCIDYKYCERCGQRVELTGVINRCACGAGYNGKGERATWQLPRTINAWAAVIHENAKKHGWYETPRTPGELLMLITCEAAEAMEEIRNGHTMTETYYDDKGKMQGVPSELADIVIRVMDMAEFYGINLEAAIDEKHIYNIQRAYKHGGKLL